MKRVVLPAVAVVAMSSVVFAGGDMKEVASAVEPVVAVPVVEELSGFYGGLGVTAVSARDSSVSVDHFSSTEGQERMGAASLQAGYNFNEYIAVEGRYNISFTHDEQVEMDGWSLFVKPQYPVTENISVYALLGYGGVNLDGESGFFPLTDTDDTDFQWGLGASYMIMHNISVFADYTWLADGMDGETTLGDKVDVDAFTLGVNYHF